MSIPKIIRDIGRPVLSDRIIMKYNQKGILIEQPIQKEQLQPNSVDLKLSGASYKRLLTNSEFEGSPVIDPAIEPRYESGSFMEAEVFTHPRYYVIQPGEFVLMASYEVLNIPNGILAFVQGRSSIARLAIQTEQAGLIDAGFRGTITFEVQNQAEHPIILREGMRVAQVYFFKAQYADKPYGAEKQSKYRGQIIATGSSIHLDPEMRGVNDA